MKCQKLCAAGIQEVLKRDDSKQEKTRWNIHDQHGRGRGEGGGREGGKGGGGRRAKSHLDKGASTG